MEHVPNLRGALEQILVTDVHEGGNGHDAVELPLQDRRIGGERKGFMEKAAGQPGVVDLGLSKHFGGGVDRRHIEAVGLQEGRIPPRPATDFQHAAASGEIFQQETLGFGHVRRLIPDGQLLGLVVVVPYSPRIHGCSIDIPCGKGNPELIILRVMRLTHEILKPLPTRAVLGSGSLPYTIISMSPPIQPRQSKASAEPGLSGLLGLAFCGEVGPMKSKYPYPCCCLSSGKARNFRITR